MGQPLATMSQINIALKRLTQARVRRTQELANQFGREKLPGSLILSLGLRETWLRNILGGAKQVGGRWVGLDPEADWEEMDAGALQISKKYHEDALRKMEGAMAGTWAVVEGANAYEKGMVPTYRDAVPFVLEEMADSLDYARTEEVPEEDRQRFAVAAHNAGKGGAMAGYRAGNVDRNTAGGDYSAWVLDAQRKVQRWLDTHPKWKV
jgi:hypothetical protein